MNKKYMIMTDKGFKSWVQDMYKSWCNRDKIAYGNLEWFIRGDKYFIIVNMKTGKTAVACRHRDDTPCFDVALAVAWARYRGLNVPVIAYPCIIEDLRYGDYFIYKDHKYLFRTVETVDGKTVINCYDFDVHFEKRLPTSDVLRDNEKIYKLK